MYAPRYYQKEAAQAALERLGRNRPALVVMPTATGKTVAMIEIIRARMPVGPVLVLAHQDELIGQFARELDASGILNVTKPDHPADVPCGAVALSTRQSMSSRKRLERFPKDFFATIVIDEAHHAPSETYKRIIGWFDTDAVVGCTATPEDQKGNLITEPFDGVTYKYPIAQAVKDGVLSGVSVARIPLRIDLRTAKTACNDYTNKSLGAALDPWLAKAAEETAKTARGRRTVVFLPLIDTARKFAAELARHGLKTAGVDSKMKSADVRRVLSDYRDGKYDVICNAMMLTEGWNCPDVDCVVILRPTRIHRLFIQMIGRGMRKAPGKGNMLLVDFLWLTDKHDIRSAADLTECDGRATVELDKILNGTDGVPMDLTEAANQAQARARIPKNGPEELLVKSIRRNRNRKSDVIEDLMTYRPAANIRMIQYVEGLARTEIEPLVTPNGRKVYCYKKYPNKAGMAIPANAYQKQQLAKLKVPFHDDVLHSEAAWYLERRPRFPATPKQMAKLAEYGFTCTGLWTKSEAHAVITKIADNDWKVPAGLRTDMLPERLVL